MTDTIQISRIPRQFKDGLIELAAAIIVGYFVGYVGVFILLLLARFVFG